MLESILHYWRTGGPLMAALAAASFGIWFYYLTMRAALAAVVRGPRGFERELAERLRSRPLAEVIPHYERGGGGPLNAIVVRVLRAVERDVPPADAFEEVEQAGMTRLSRDLTLLSAFTAAAPLLGLLGTVLGMVATFSAVATAGGDTAVQVSSGISQALITTQFGLITAIPGLFGIARIRRVMDQARVRSAACRTHLLMGLEARGGGAA